MHVDRLSATALQAAMLCLARFKAQRIDKTDGVQSDAGKFGTAIHASLEKFVQIAYIEQRMEPALDLLVDLWKIEFSLAYSDMSEDPAELKLGIDILKRWYERADLDQEGREVLSVESKEIFQITVDGKTVDFVYIIDRLDRMPDGSLTVVDYKTSAWALNHDDLRSKVQPRIYALAVQLKYPEAPGVWVEFDFLKHENQPIGVYFSKAENLATWKALGNEIRKIHAAPDDPPPTLNNECLFCPIKTTCPALTRNLLGKGVMSYSIEELVDLRAQLEYQKSAVIAAQKEADAVLLAHAKENDIMEIEGNTEKLAVAVKGTRAADGELVHKVIGDVLWHKYGQEDITMGAIDKLLKGTELTDDQKKQLRGLIRKNYGQPYLKAKGGATLGGI